MKVIPEKRWEQWIWYLRFYWTFNLPSSIKYRCLLEGEGFVVAKHSELRLSRIICQTDEQNYSIALLLLFGSNIVCCFIGEKKVLNGCKITYKSNWIRKTRFWKYTQNQKIGKSSNSRVWELENERS